jgi:anti-sigma factor RsiW
VTRKREVMTARRPSPHCRALLAELSRHLDGELTASRRREIERHLADCHCCDEMAARLRLTAAVCRGASAKPMPARVKARAEARIRALLADIPRGRRPSASSASRSKTR